MEDEMVAEHKNLSNDIQSLRMVLSHQEENFSSFYEFEDETNKSRELIEQLISLNREYQHILQLCDKQIEAAKLRNTELQSKIKSLTQAKSKKAAPKKSVRSSFFSNPMNECPPPNADTERKEVQERKTPIHFKYQKWSKAERESLETAITQQNKKIFYCRFMEEFRGPPHNKTITEASRLSTEQVNALAPSQFVEDVRHIDWGLVSSQHVTTRSPMDCRLEWINNSSPTINQSKWTKDEDKRLLALVKKYNGFEWEQIAAELETQRTPFDCFRRYQRSLNTAIVKGKWTAQEDETLRNAIKIYGVKNWQQVANCLSDRTGQQCLHRWTKSLRPNIKRGRWEPAEDKALTLAVKAYGSKSWVKVQQHVPGRTDVQCRERWVNILNPKLKVGPWTDAEDKKLDDAVQRYGLGKWSQVSQILAPRTDNQCWRRWKALHHKELESYRETILKKKSGMVNNFVGREKERPQLTPDDFDVNASQGAVLPNEGHAAPEGAFHAQDNTPAFGLQTTSNTLPLLLDSKCYPTTYSPHELPASLPLLLPQPRTFQMLNRLSRCLNEIQMSKPSEGLTEEEENRLITNPEFSLLGGVFNSLYLCPALIHAKQFFQQEEEEQPPPE